MSAARVTTIFRGRVQGVGFRATARSIAMQFAVTGYVRNEFDESVRCVIEGEPEEIERFVAALRAEMGPLISDVETKSEPATGEFTSFTIRR